MEVSKYRQSPTYHDSTYDILTSDISIYDISTLRWCESDMQSVETVLQILNMIFSWASDMRYDTPLCVINFSSVLQTFIRPSVLSAVYINGK